MPRKVTFVSSISGKEVDESEAWSVRISGPGDDDYYEADTTEDEAKKVIADVKADKKAKRGRKPADTESDKKDGKADEAKS